MKNNNKSIGDFMDIRSTGLSIYKESAYHYHDSWDWLMPVIRKVLTSIDIDSLNYDTDELKFNVLDCDIEGAHKEVVEFIKQYNDESYFLCGSCGERCSEYTYSEDRDIDECNDCKTSNHER